MWRVFLSFVTHRLFLVIVALSALHFQPTGQVPFSELLSRFSQRISQSSEVQAINSNESSPREPLLWIVQKLSRVVPFPTEFLLLGLSNLFFFLFLWELYLFVNTMALPEVAVDTCLLSILWLTSYEMSLGSALSLNCFLGILSLRSALDHRWLVTGLTLALLALTKPFAFFLLPLLLGFLLSQKKYSSPDAFARHCIYLLLPFLGAVFLRRDLYQNLGSIFQDSSLLSLIQSKESHWDLSWTYSTQYLGQTISLAILIIGSILCFFVFSTLLHKILPLFLVLALLLTTPYRELASNVLLAAPAFSGIAEVCSTPILRIIQLILLFFGAVEVFNLF